MSARTKTPEHNIVFLLACLKHAEHVDFQAVAVETGLYKSKKFAKQAYDNLVKKYGPKATDDTGTKAGKAASKAIGAGKRKTGAVGGKAGAKKQKTEAELRTESESVKDVTDED